MFREAKEVDSQTSPLRRNTRVRYCALRWLRNQEELDRQEELFD